jgi:hypothetical protein
MNPGAKHTISLLILLFILAFHTQAAEGAGKVCIAKIPTGDNWQANDTGATERSIFTVQIDDRPSIQISTNSSGVFTNLSPTAKHLVKVKLDGKPITSFRFSFNEHQDHLRLSYTPFYGTWSLSPIDPGEKCACQNPKSSKKNASSKSR